MCIFDVCLSRISFHLLSCFRSADTLHPCEFVAYVEISRFGSEMHFMERLRTLSVTVLLQVFALLVISAFSA